MKVLELYRRMLAAPTWVFVGFGLICCVAAFPFSRFSFDASADTLVVEGDPGLDYYRQAATRFGGDEFLILTYTASDADVFAPAALRDVTAIVAELESIAGVEGVFSILDAPLLQNDLTAPGVSDDYVTLRDAGVDVRSARVELLDSPLFADYLVSADARSTAIRIGLTPEGRLDRMQIERDRLRTVAEPTEAQAETLAVLENDYRQARGDFQGRRDRLIERVRSVRHQFSDRGTLYLGGVPMIAADMIRYVKTDMVVFGAAVLLIVSLMLCLFFRRLRWVLLPVANSALAVYLTMAWLGLVDRPVTVVSANFVAVLAIVSISLTIHLIVRYRELLSADPDIDHEALVVATMQSKFAPCLYTALTTMVAFGSLVTSRIVPVVDFGWMMCVGVMIGFAVTFSFFPAMLRGVGKGIPSTTLGRPLWVVNAAATITQRHSRGVVIGAVAVSVLAVVGMLQLRLNDRFIDYFDADSDIHQGMRFIDAQLGGTVPLDVIVDLEPYAPLAMESDDDFASPEPDTDSDLDPERYWYTPDKVALIDRLHQHLDSHPSVGKVLSLATLERIGRKFNDDRPLDAVQIIAVMDMLSDPLRREILAPYASPATGEVRLSARIHETGPRLDRDALIAEITGFAEAELGLRPERVHATGMFVLFNDMLQQLLNSQINTLAVVLAVTFAMFTVLLRSVTLGLIGMLPNLFAAGCILGVMGLFQVPLDMMTITIAAITIGIGVDNTIHFLHRFRDERQHNPRQHSEARDVRAAVLRAGTTIGRAMYFTSVTITAGFSTLALSSFEPTVHFGLLTAFAMVLAVVADLTLLPALLIQLLGREPKNSTMGA